MAAIGSRRNPPGPGCQMCTRCSGCTLKCPLAVSMCGRATSEPRPCHGQAIMSAAGFAEMALAAGRQAVGLPVDAVQLTRLEIEQTLVLDGQTRVTTQFASSADGDRVEIHAS